MYLDSAFSNKEIIPLLQRAFPLWVRCLTVETGQVSLTLRDRSLILPFLLSLKKSSLFRFSSLMDLFGVDFLPNSAVYRFELNYFLLSTFYLQRLRIRLHLSSQESVESVSSLFGSANWLEREVWDMYGLFFFNHPDLRRILTDYGFKGFPLRKDFPLSGYTEVRYSEKKKRVITKPVQLSQEYRYFEFQTPWERFFNK